MEHMLQTGAIEVLFGMIIIPWFVWTTVAIFNLKQEQAVMRSEMGLIQEIKDWLQENRK